MSKPRSGTKSHLGEAKPDYKDRTAREKINKPPKKKRHIGAVHETDVSLGKPENTAQRPRKVSPSGRITHPLEIRPVTALPLEVASRNDVLLGLATPQVQSNSSLPNHQQIFDLESEKVQCLAFLNSLFGSRKDDDDWIGRESIGSDVEAEESAKEDLLLPSDEHTFDEVPRTPGRDQSDQKSAYKDDSNPPKRDLPTTKAVTPTVPNTAVMTLKDLFAPREEATFSLLDHLDLDIALDEDLSFLDEPSSAELIPHEPSQIAPQTQPMARTSYSQSTSRIVLNPKQALFFPLLSSETNELNKARQRDAYDLIRDNGWYWRDPAVRFWNTESEEEVKKRWEACRGELTKGWKQRWREAGKVRRRKKLANADMML